MGGALLGSASTPALGRSAHNHQSIHVSKPRNCLGFPENSAIQFTSESDVIYIKKSTCAQIALLNHRSHLCVPSTHFGVNLSSCELLSSKQRTVAPHVWKVPNLEGGDNPLPPLDGWGGATPRPSTTAGAYGRPSSSNPEIEAGENGRLFTPPK